MDMICLDGLPQKMLILFIKEAWLQSIVWEESLKLDPIRRYMPFGHRIPEKYKEELQSQSETMEVFQMSRVFNLIA